LAFGRSLNLVAARVTSSDPIIYLGELELPQAADFVGGQPLMLDPPVDRILGDPKVFRNIFDGNPGFDGHQPFLGSVPQRGHRRVGLLNTVARKLLQLEGA
jgi:hypothetical protein